MPEESSPLGLADMLRALRQELEQARRNVGDKKPLLNLEAAEVEVKFTVAKEGKGTAGVKVHFFAVEVGGTYKSEEVHRLTLKLSPPKEKGEELTPLVFSERPGF